MKRRTFLVLAGGRLLPGAGEAAFHFQNNFLVNLHHFTRGESRRRNMNLALVLPPGDLSEKERSTWNESLQAYADLAKVNLVFDERLIRINNALALQGGDSVPAGIIELKIAAALNSAAPIYRAHFWDRHRRDNAEWIQNFAAEAERRAPAVTKALAEAYHVRWPTRPILVDLACESGPNLAYTTGGPPGTAGHTVIAPLQNQIREVALETVFHEASHTVDGDIIEIIEGEAAGQKLTAPDELWHALIFYTTGEIVRRELGKQNDPAYKPYAYRAGVYERGDWPRLRASLERDWQPYLDGRTRFAEALHDLVRDTGR